MLLVHFCLPAPNFTFSPDHQHIWSFYFYSTKSIFYSWQHNPEIRSCLSCIQNTAYLEIKFYNYTKPPHPCSHVRLHLPKSVYSPCLSHHSPRTSVCHYLVPQHLDKTATSVTTVRLTTSACFFNVNNI